MRQSHRATFVQETMKEEYNPETGEYEDGITGSEVMPSFVMDLGVERSMRLFGDYKEQRKIVILRHPYYQPFNYIEYRGERYIVVRKGLDGCAYYIERDRYVKN